jgi:hypothetical protein
MWTKAFWKATFERAVKSAAQAPLAAFLVGDVALNAFDIDWSEAGGLALGGAVLSVLTSLASTGSGGTGPSLGPEQLAPEVER